MPINKADQIDDEYLGVLRNNKKTAAKRRTKKITHENWHSLLSHIWW